jgi:GT2 family glycosyltransferase
VYGAGCVYRMSVITKLYQSGFKNVLGTRREQKVDVSGEDTELCFAVRMLGFGIWYNDDMVFQHYMPEGRMTDKRYLSLQRGGGVEAYALGFYQLLLRKRLKNISYCLWLHYQFCFIKQSVALYLRNSFSEDLPVIKEGKKEQIKYRFITIMNQSYCYRCYRQIKSNLRAIAKAIQ